MKYQFLKITSYFFLAVTVLFSVTCKIEAQTTEDIKNPKQFLFPEFTKTTVAMKGGKDLTMMINYNVVTEKMVFLQKGDIYDMVYYESVDTVYLNGSKFIPAANVFYEVALNAPVSLFIQHKGKIQSPPKPAAYGGTSEISSSTYISNIPMGTDVYRLKNEAELVIRPETVYWIRIDNEMKDFLSESQFLNLVPDLKNPLKQYIRENRIKFKSEEDVTKLISFLNTLRK